MFNSSNLFNASSFKKYFLSLLITNTPQLAAGNRLKQYNQDMETLNKGQHSAYQIHYHFVTPIKYRKAIFENVECCNSLILITKEIEERYEIEFEQVGIDENHIHYCIKQQPKVLTIEDNRNSKKNSCARNVQSSFGLKKRTLGRRALG